MYEGYISWIDLLLIPLYFAVLYLVMLMIRRRHRDNLLYRKYLVRGFVFKIACTIFYCCIIYYYYGYGDSINYFRNVLFLRNLVSSGSEPVGLLFREVSYMKDTYHYVSTESGWLVEKMAWVLSYFGLARFVITSMIFATIAYSGMFKMFQTFAEIMPGWHKRISWAVLFFPSLAVYGSGILKDTVCLSALGWILYCSYRVFMKKQLQARYILMLVFCIFLIYLVKAYIIAAFALPYIIFLLMRLISRVKSRYFRRIIMPTLLGLMVIGYVAFASQIDDMLGTYAIEKLFDSVKEQQQSYIASGDAEAGSVYTLGSFEPTLSGFLKLTPAGINATLFRPYLWETKNVLMLFTALESLALLLVTIFVLWKAGVVRFVKTIFNDPFVFLCMFYSLVFAAIVGISTLNFGTLARYRIPVIPFYLCAILAVLYQARKASLKKPHESIG